MENMDFFMRCKKDNRNINKEVKLTVILQISGKVHKVDSSYEKDHPRKKPSQTYPTNK
jgi:hypothetical protein